MKNFFSKEEISKIYSEAKQLFAIQIKRVLGIDVDINERDTFEKAMFDYLHSHGWPNMPDPDKFVLNQAENMFKELLRLNLVKYTDWEPYYMAAITQFERAQMRRAGFNV